MQSAGNVSKICLLPSSVKESVITKSFSGDQPLDTVTAPPVTVPESVVVPPVILKPAALPESLVETECHRSCFFEVEEDDSRAYWSPHCLPERSIDEAVEFACD